VRSTVITAECPVRPALQGWERPSAKEPDPTNPEEDPVASVSKLVKDFARSPKGQQLIEQVKAQASKPENRRKLEELRVRYLKRR
jgi:hypothetical protein